MPVASHELANSIPSRAFSIGRRMQMSARPDLGRETEKDTPLAAQREGSSQPLDTDESTPTDNRYAPASDFSRPTLRCRGRNRDMPRETVSLAAEVEVLRLVVVELVRRLPREDRTAIEALVQQLATTAEDLSALPTSGEADENRHIIRMPPSGASWACCSFSEAGRSLLGGSEKVRRAS